MPDQVKYLFYYGLILSSLLFLASLLFLLPFPQNVVFTVLLLPIAFYIWVNLKKVEGAPGLVLALSILGVSGLATLIYSTWSSSSNLQKILGTMSQGATRELQEEFARKDEANEKLAEELSEIKEELSLIKTNLEIESQVLGLEEPLSSEPTLNTTAGLTQLGQISAKANQTVSVYREQQTSSPVVGTLSFGQKYPYFLKESGWYLVKVNEDIEGWVSAQNVYETTEP